MPATHREMLDEVKRIKQQYKENGKKKGNWFSGSWEGLEEERKRHFLLCAKLNAELATLGNINAHSTKESRNLYFETLSVVSYEYPVSMCLFGVKTDFDLLGMEQDSKKYMQDVTSITGGYDKLFKKYSKEEQQSDAFKQELDHLNKRTSTLIKSISQDLKKMESMSNSPLMKKIMAEKAERDAKEQAERQRLGETSSYTIGHQEPIIDSEKGTAILTFQSEEEAIDFYQDAAKKQSGATDTLIYFEGEPKWKMNHRQLLDMDNKPVPETRQNKQPNSQNDGPESDPSISR